MSDETLERQILSLVDVQKHYSNKGWRRRNATRAVDGVSLDIGNADVVGIAGESGCGKSTLARLMCGLVTPSRGEVRWEGKSIWTFDRLEWKRFRREVQMVFQDSEASLNPRKKIGDIVAMPLQAQRIGTRADRREKVLALLQQVQLSPPSYYSKKYPHELSGGAKQRVGIARALALEPKLLVADEPVASLDTSIRGEILALLRDLYRNLGISVVLISHDLNVLRTLCSRIAVMYLGKLIEYGPTATVFSSPQHHYTNALLSLRSVPDPRRARDRHTLTLEGEVPSASDPPPGCRFHPRCPHKIQECWYLEPRLREMGPAHFAACHNPARVVYLPETTDGDKPSH